MTYGLRCAPQHESTFCDRSFKCSYSYLEHRQSHSLRYLLQLSILVRKKVKSWSIVTVLVGNHDASTIQRQRADDSSGCTWSSRSSGLRVRCLALRHYFTDHPSPAKPYQSCLQRVDDTIQGVHPTQRHDFGRMHICREESERVQRCSSEAQQSIGEKCPGLERTARDTRPD